MYSIGSTLYQYHVFIIQIRHSQTKPLPYCRTQRLLNVRVTQPDSPATTPASTVPRQNPPAQLDSPDTAPDGLLALGRQLSLAPHQMITTCKSWHDRVNYHDPHPRTPDSPAKRHRSSGSPLILLISAISSTQYGREGK